MKISKQIPEAKYIMIKIDRDVKKKTRIQMSHAAHTCVRTTTTNRKKRIQSRSWEIEIKQKLIFHKQEQSKNI